jgi:hypothetical protein
MTDQLPAFLSFLNSCSGSNPLEKLKTMANHPVGKKKLSIKFTYSEHNKETLYILNYDQIHSPEFDPYANVCRSLPLCYDEKMFVPIGRSYDRFPDYDENRRIADLMLTSLDKLKTKFDAREKKDGSIIHALWFKSSWIIMTKGTFGTGTVGKLPITFGELFEKYLGGNVNDVFAKTEIDKSYTWIFEIYDPTGNHVISRSEPFLCLLDARKISGEYADSKILDEVSEKLKVSRPKLLGENITIPEIQEKLNDMYKTDPLSEGAVLTYTDENNTRHMLKVKPPAYHVFHKYMMSTRGPNLTISDVALRLYFVNYLETEMKAQNVTEDEKKKIDNIIRIYNSLMSQTKNLCKRAFSITKPKAFAIEVGTFPFAKYIFQAKKKAESAEDMYNLVHKMIHESDDIIIDVVKSKLS